MNLVIGECDSARTARVLHSWPLYYSAGADVGLDRPEFVRAGSGLAAIGRRMAVIQDDAHFVALVDVVRRHVDAIALPAGFGGGRQFDDRRGNRHWKLDLEACTSIAEDGRELLLALGSGSTPAREHALLIAWPPRRAVPSPTLQEDVRLVHLPKFYAALRSQFDFAGSELNIEGAVFLGGDCLRLLQRGNGAACQGRVAVNATCDVSWQLLRAHLDDPASPIPTPRNIVQYELGAIDGTRLTFTDAAVRRSCGVDLGALKTNSPKSANAWQTGGLLHGEAFFFTATAEASPNAVEDGPVAGSVLGQIDAGGKATWTVLCDHQGDPLRSKVEGLCFDLDDADRAWILIDRDDPLTPAELCEVLLQGNWNHVDSRV